MSAPAKKKAPRPGHTPGPWKVIEPDENRPDMDNEDMVVAMDTAIPYFESDAGQFNPTHMWHASATMPGERHYPEHLANARLIAAAPDLLEALEALVEHAKIRPAFALPGVKGVREGGKFLAAVEAAEAAIAKATGGES